MITVEFFVAVCFKMNSMLQHGHYAHRTALQAVPSVSCAVPGKMQQPHSARIPH